MNLFCKSCFYLSVLLLLNVQCKGQRNEKQHDSSINEIKSLSWKITSENRIFCFKPDVKFMETQSEILIIDVTEVKNEMLYPVYINVFFRTGDADFSIGNFTLYPADKPSVFKFRTSDVIKNIESENEIPEIKELCFIYILESELKKGKADFIELNITVRKEAD